MRSVTRTQPVREERRKVIRAALSEAVESILQGGTPYAEMSVERLCQEAGTSRATFYQYFQDKADLLAQLAQDALRSLGETALFWWHLPAGSDRQALQSAFQRTFDLYREHRGVMRSLSECAAYDRAMKENLWTILNWAIAETTRHIEEGIRIGTVRPDVDAESTAEWLCWMFERGLYEVAGDVDEQELERMLTAVSGIVWNLLYREDS